MTLVDGRLMADFACLDPVYVDGIAGTGSLGSNFATFYFRWMPKYSEAGHVIYERVPAVYLIRPRASMLCTTPCLLKNWIDAGDIPRPVEVPARIN